MRDDRYPQRRPRRDSITAAALVAVALAVALGPVGSSSASSAAEPWTLTFDDRSGDASGAPDLTRVAIDGTDVSGTYMFTRVWPISIRLLATALNERSTSGWTLTRTIRLDRPLGTNTTCTCTSTNPTTRSGA